MNLIRDRFQEVDRLAAEGTVDFATRFTLQMFAAVEVYLRDQGHIEAADTVRKCAEGIINGGRH